MVKAMTSNGIVNGRIAHYVQLSPTSWVEHLAAVVVHVHDQAAGTVNLAVWDANGQPFVVTSVTYDNKNLNRPDTWHYPTDDPTLSPTV